MPTWYVRVTTFEHFRIDADTPERAGELVLEEIDRTVLSSWVQSEVLGFDVSATDAEGDPVGEAAVAGGEYPPQETGPAATEETP